MWLPGRRRWYVELVQSAIAEAEDPASWNDGVSEQARRSYVMGLRMGAALMGAPPEVWESRPAQDGRAG